MLFHQGPAARFRALLGAAHLAGKRAVAKLAPVYRRPVGREDFVKGVLSFQHVRKADRRFLTRPRGACHFFYDYDEQFPEARPLRRALCAGFGGNREGGRCNASLQTRGAFVPRHCDHVDVVVLQIFGTRRWRLQRNSDPPRGIGAAVRLPEKLRRGWSADFSGDSTVVTLKPGAALYVPRGWWHETRSSGDSFALIIGLAPRKRARSRPRRRRD